MQRSIWRGAISFGLIYVPVELYGASTDGSLSLHLLDSRDFAPVGYQRINKTTGKEVDWAHIVKGSEYEKGRYVALSDADFKHANVKASETIDIANFTSASDIPAMYFDTPYFLPPQKGGQRVRERGASAVADQGPGRGAHRRKAGAGRARDGEKARGADVRSVPGGRVQGYLPQGSAAAGAGKDS